jgi:alpha-galactosidase
MKKLLLPLLLCFGAPGHAAQPPVASLASAGLRIDYDARLHSRVVALVDGVEIPIGAYSPSESLRTVAGELRDFRFDSHEQEPFADAIGTGLRHRLMGHANGVSKSLLVTLYDDFPQLAVVQVTYTNTSRKPLKVLGWSNSRYEIAATPTPKPTPAPAAAAAAAPVAAASARAVDFWSYQSGSYEKRPDWVLPVPVGFRQANYQGMNASDYGGGTPIVDVWRRDAGIAVGHLELTPRLVSLPVTRPGAAGVTLALSFSASRTLAPGQSIATLRSFVAVHRGDHFQTLRSYRRFMLRQGVQLAAAPPSAFEPIWCAWGYGRNFTPEQINATLPVVKQLGFGWVTLDDGWQVSEGDWTPTPGKYPHGDDDMKALVASIHAAGLKAQLWWSPLAVRAGSPFERHHPEQLLLNGDASTRKISWWDAHYLCPAYAPVQADAAAFVRKALGEWGFDGLKIDGQHLNGAPRCFNPAHHHEQPEASVTGVPEFFKAVFAASLAVKPDALVEICPCGTSYSFFTMPYLNMMVASDPESSWQVRLKGKTLKALSGDGVAYFGDHVEMSEGGDDFASALGVGAVVGSNFVWPGAPGKKDPKLLLTPEREKLWAFWLQLYQAKRLSEGEYLGELYDLGFDRPEAHAIRKGERFYYAFYAQQYQGTIELRGLGTGRYRVHDYEADVDLGVITGPTARLSVDFRRHLLLEALPE